MVDVRHDYEWQDEVQSLIDRQLMFALSVKGRDVEKVKVLNRMAQELVTAVADLVDNGNGWPVYEADGEPRDKANEILARGKERAEKIRAALGNEKFEEIVKQPAAE
jgi:hypothetical protein